MLSINKLSIDRPRFRPGSVKAYAVAGAIVAIATALRMTLNPWVTGLPFVVFFPAVMVATFLGGPAAGLLAVILSVLSAWFFVLSSEISYQSIYLTAVFGIGATTVTVVIGAMRAATADVRRLNETLRISEGKFRGLLESAPDAMVIADKQRRIVLVNVQAETLFGYRREELLGQPIEILMPERNRGMYLAQLTEVAAVPHATCVDPAIDLYGLDKDGREFPVEMSLCPFMTEHGILVSSAIRDITQRKRIEADLAAAGKAKSEFLNSMSHELRTPLNAILGFGQLLHADDESSLTTKQREYVSYILQGGEHLLGLVSQLLDLVAIEKDRIKLSVGRVSVREMLTQVHGLMSPLARTSGVIFKASVSDGLPDILADELRLRQVLLNLLSNAMKYNRSGGMVSLAALPGADGQIRIAITDTGIGIPLAHQKNLFQPFERLGAERAGIDGTGIGLALSRKLIEAMSGTMGFVSQPGQGSVFWVELPAAATRIAAAAVDDRRRTASV